LGGSRCRTFAILGFNTLLKNIRDFEFRISIGSLFHNFMDDGRTRLRMNSSSLNEHLFIRNLVDSPNCACGQVESTSHFLISCKKYTDLHNELMYTINYPVTIDVKLLLKGSDTLSVDQNIAILGFNMLLKNIQEP
jgi:hypothetical protein